MPGSAYTTDSSSDAEAVQLELLRQMSPQQRIKVVCGLSNNIRQMVFSAIRRRHPDYSENQVRLVFIELTYGKDLADDVKRWQESRS